MAAMLIVLYVIGALDIWEISCISATRLGPSSPKFPVILIFGDSTVDSGNNDYIDTVFKADFLPYGQDYPGHIPTGRFSNGKLIPDFLAATLKIKDTVPPFLDANLTNTEFITGVSFASAGSGYDDSTYASFNVVPFSKQIELFKNYLGKLKGIVGEEKATKLISSALVIISAGTNDISTWRMDLNDTAYQDFLLNRTQYFYKELYDLGCRSMIIAGLPPIGCLPIQITPKFPNPSERKCLDYQNSYAQLYNQKFVKLLLQIEATLSGSKIVYLDVYETLIDMIKHPKKYGFVETTIGCCGSGFAEMGPLCNADSGTCPNPSQFLFWDAIHPSLSAYQYIAKYVEEKVLPKLM